MECPSRFEGANTLVVFAFEEEPKFGVCRGLGVGLGGLRG